MKIVYQTQIEPATDPQVSRLIFWNIIPLSGESNGMRHGESNVFELQLTYDEPLVIFRLKYHGKPVKETNHGFGLQAMKRQSEKTEAG